MGETVPEGPDPLTDQAITDLRALMAAEEISLAAMARRLGQNPSGIAALFNLAVRGERGVTLRKLHQMADAVGVDVFVMYSRRTVRRKGLIDIGQAARLVGVSRNTMHKWITQGHLEPVPGVKEFKRYEPAEVVRVAAERKASWGPQGRAAARRYKGGERKRER